jgi:hypothetical protein
LVVRLSCPLSLPSLLPVSVAAIKLPVSSKTPKSKVPIYKPPTNSTLTPKT